MVMPIPNIPLSIGKALGGYSVIWSFRELLGAWALEVDSQGTRALGHSSTLGTLELTALRNLGI